MTSTTSPVFLRSRYGVLYNASFILSISTPDPFWMEVDMHDDETLVFEAVRAPHEGEDRRADLVAKILETGKQGGGILHWTGKVFEVDH